METVFIIDYKHKDRHGHKHHTLRPISGEAEAKRTVRNLELNKAVSDVRLQEVETQDE